MAFSTILFFVWTRLLQLPDNNVDQYNRAAFMTAMSAVVILMGEPFYIVGQVYLHVKFRSAIDVLYVTLGVILQCIIVTSWSTRVVLYMSYATFGNSILYLTLNVAYFWWQIKQQHNQPQSQQRDRIPFHSIVRFLPSLTHWSLNAGQARIFYSFFKQSFLKQILTEGEKYVFTWFNLLTLSEQGVYDAIANLGSIPARLIFSKVEEGAHLYFSQIVHRGDGNDSESEREASRHLHLLLKGLLLFGLVVAIFGFSFSHMLLHLYGGTLLSSDVGPTLLRLHCFYILFLALNGISECYAFCVMTCEQVSSYNLKMGTMTGFYLLLTWFFAKTLGPAGLTLANCCNFIMRIAHNFRVIKKRHESASVKPLEELFPTPRTLFTLLMCGSLCFLSECYFYSTTAHGMLLHFIVGASSFLLCLYVLVKQEKWLVALFWNRLKKE